MKTLQNLLEDKTITGLTKIVYKEISSQIVDTLKTFLEEQTVNRVRNIDTFTMFHLHLKVLHLQFGKSL